MIEFLKTDAEGKTSPVPRPEPGCWVNVRLPTAEERAWLLSDLGVIPEFVASAFDAEESSHVDFDDDTGQALVIVDYPSVEPDANGKPNGKAPPEGKTPPDGQAGMQYDTQPLSFLFLPERGLVVTVSLFDCPTVDALVKGRPRQVDTRTPARFLLQATLSISQYYLSSLRSISKQFVKTERQLRASLRNDDLIKMLGLEKSLLYFSTSLKADKATLGKIRMGRTVELSEDDRDLLDDVIIELEQAIEMTTITTSILTRTMDTFSSVIGNNLNAAMRRLTVVTVVLAVPTVVFSFFGMNNADLPIEVSWAIPTLFSLLAAFIVAVLLEKIRRFK